MIFGENASCLKYCFAKGLRTCWTRSETLELNYYKDAQERNGNVVVGTVGVQIMRQNQQNASGPDCAQDH